MLETTGPHCKVAVTPGQIVAERYRIEAPLERGAMGAVWRASHLRLDSPVAIKFLSPALAKEPEMLARFLREAHSAALVRSSHVVQVFDCGVERELPFIVMELLEGESLEKRLERRGRLAPLELDKIVTEVTRGLVVAHEAGIIHRDLKPSNIFLAREGESEVTKVLDFGVAKWLDRKLSAPVSARTGTGVTLGTPQYMSPEQARGDRQLDHRTDLWSLAVVAFECLTGKLPFRGKGVGELMVNICTLDPLLPSALARVPPGFDSWFSRAAAKDPSARFASGKQMAAALHAVLCPEPRPRVQSGFATIEARRTTRGVGPMELSRSAGSSGRARRRARARVFVGAVSGLAAGLLFWSWLNVRARASSDQERAALALRPAVVALAPLLPTPAEARPEPPKSAPPHPAPEALGEPGNSFAIRAPAASPRPQASPPRPSPRPAPAPSARVLRPRPEPSSPPQDPFSQRL